MLFDPNHLNTYEQLHDRSFYRVVDIEDSVKWCPAMEGGTLKWWLGQKAEALQALVAGEAVLLRNALTDLANYATDRSAYSPLPKHYRPHIPAAKVVWAKGPDFDCKILQHACEAVSIPYPFHFSNHRCVRTIIDVAFPDPDQRPEFTGVAHDARDDAINQALSVQMAYQALRLNHTPTTANPTTLPLVTT